MFRDTKKELERLERELLAEEEPAEQPQPEDWEADYADASVKAWEDNLLDDPDDFGEEHPGIYQNYSNGYGRNQPSHYDVYNTDQTDENPEELSEAIQEPTENNTGLLITACILLLGIAGVLIFWVLRYFR